MSERETRCTEFISSHLDEDLEEGSLHFYAWKSNLVIRDVDLYHQVAQSLQQKELKRDHVGMLFYTIRVPTFEGDKFGDIWNVSLEGEPCSNLLKKYGEHYEVTHIR